MGICDEKSGNADLLVGNVRLRGRAFLAPMSGVTDVGMRRIAARFGAGMVVSEMVASDSYVRGEAEAGIRAAGAGLDLHVVQLAGRDPHWMSEAGRLAEANGAAMIDINMGCPARRVTGGYAGSALMRDPRLALAIIEATVAAVRVPVTLKTRLGWDAGLINAPDLARQAEEAGIRMVTIHGRTRCQFYKGRADWAAIRQVRSCVSIPVVANGDCASLDDARSMLQMSGADAVMVGRAAVGKPWLVGAIARGLEGGRPAPLAAGMLRDAALEHYESLLEQFGAKAGARHARKHLAAYADSCGWAAGRSERIDMLTTDDPARVRGFIGAMFSEFDIRQAA